MCMSGTKEGCILLERMAKVEAKLWALIALFGVLVFVLSLITFKLLDSHIYLLAGEQGLHAVSVEAREDVQTTIKQFKRADK